MAVIGRLKTVIENHKGGRQTIAMPPRPTKRGLEGAPTDAAEHRAILGGGGGDEHEEGDHPAGREAGETDRNESEREACLEEGLGKRF